LPTPYSSTPSVDVAEIRQAFRHEPCLLCVLAKRRKEGTLHWIKKAAGNPRSKLRTKQETSEDLDIITRQLTLDQKVKLGEILYIDDVPVNPTSIGGKNYFWAVRCTKGRKIFTYPTKHNDDDSYHACLITVLAFFKNLYLCRPELGTRPRTIIRTDRFKTFLSEKSRLFYESNNCVHQPASAYRHHQVAAERDIQTIVNNVAAAVHTNDFIRVSSWDQAVIHWTKLHGHTPLSETGLSPNQMLYQGSTSSEHIKEWTVDLHKYFRFAFGDIVVYPLEKGIEYKKFSLKNDVGFYMGDDSSDSVHVYRAYYHDIISKPGAARVDVSDVQLLRWLHKRADVRKPTLHFNGFREAFLELAPHYYHYDDGNRVDGPAIITPDMSIDPELSVADPPDAGEDESEQATVPEPTELLVPVDADESSQGKTKVSRAHPPAHKSKAKPMPHRNYRSYSDRLVLPVHTQPMAPRELRHRKPVDYAEMSKGKSEYLNIRTVSAVKAYYPPPDPTEDQIVDLATIMA
jgi:hypothetical protein